MSVLSVTKLRWHICLTLLLWISKKRSKSPIRTNPAVAAVAVVRKRTRLRRAILLTKQRILSDRQMYIFPSWTTLHSFCHLRRPRETRSLRKSTTNMACRTVLMALIQTELVKAAASETDTVPDREMVTELERVME